jgi:hypothetical protein
MSRIGRRHKSNACVERVYSRASNQTASVQARNLVSTRLLTSDGENSLPRLDGDETNSVETFDEINPVRNRSPYFKRNILSNRTSVNQSPNADLAAYLP